MNMDILLEGKLMVKNDDSLTAWSVWRSLHACCDRLFMSTLCAEKVVVVEKYACRTVMRSRNTTVVEHLTR